MSRVLAVRLGIWSTVLQMARLGINALVFFALARVLPLDEIGAFSVAFAVAQIAQAFIRTGVLETIIAATRDAVDDDYLAAGQAVIFLWGGGLCLALAAAGIAMWAFGWAPRAGLYLAGVSALPVTDALGIVPDAIMRRDLRFKALAIRTTLALTFAAALALVAGLSGAGGWALVAFTVGGSILASVLALMLCGRKLRVSWNDHARKISSSALRLAASALASASITPISQVAVGVMAGPASAGAYAIAHRLVSVLTALTVEPARIVALPLLTRTSEDPENRRRAIAKGLGLMMTLMTPLYLGLYVAAPVALPLLLGENGELSAPVVSALSWQFLPLAISVIVAQLLIAVHQPREILVFTTVQALTNIVVSFATATLGAVTVAWAFTLRAYALVPLVLRQAWRRGGTPPGVFLRAIFPPALAGVLMAAFLMYARHWSVSAGQHAWLTLLLLLACGAALYPLLLALIARDHYRVAASAIVSAIKRRRA